MSESETPRTDVQRRLAGAFDQDGMVGMAAHAEQLERELAAAKAWKDAVIEKLAITWAITSENENCPQKAIDDLVASQVAIALDPAVSSDAAALIERGRQEMRAEVERLRGIVPEFLEKLNDELCAENERLRTQVEALRAALERISKVKPDQLDYSIDVCIIERCAKVARAALAKEKA
jgi:LPS O-antigen subunit length determinant protein (WzzB/FepE family)